MRPVNTAKGRTVIFINIVILLTTVGIAYNKLFAMDTVLYNTDSNCNIPKVVWIMCEIILSLQSSFHNNYPWGLSCLIRMFPYGFHCEAEPPITEHGLLFPVVYYYS